MTHDPAAPPPTELVGHTFDTEAEALAFMFGLCPGYRPRVARVRVHPGDPRTILVDLYCAYASAESRATLVAL